MYTYMRTYYSETEYTYDTRILEDLYPVALDYYVIKLRTAILCDSGVHWTS